MITGIEEKAGMDVRDARLFDSVDEAIKKSIMTYLDYLLDYNEMVNLISRKITWGALMQLLNETMLVARIVSNRFIIDAGSGNGILGVPIAIMNPDKKIYCVESKKKKVFFLAKIKEDMNLKNLVVVHNDIRNSRDWPKKKKCTMIARGFPGFDIFFDFLKKGLISEAVLITSENKIKKIEKDMVNVKKKTYNIPLRNQLKILKMENVSRET